MQASRKNSEPYCDKVVKPRTGPIDRFSMKNWCSLLYSGKYGIEPTMGSEPIRGGIGPVDVDDVRLLSL
jgi:hypothetical protein